MNNENIRQTIKGMSASMSPKRSGKELAASSILTNHSKPSKEETSNLFKSCKLSAANMVELKKKAQMIEIN